MDVMFLIEPLPEWHHHVQQHFVAISHQQRPGHVKSSMSKDCSHTLPGKGWGGAERHDSHCSNARAAATSTSGFTSIPSAQASRSGSRTEERRVGKECARTSRYRWSRYT